VLETIAEEIAGPDGEVWVVAPAFEQSGVAHRISYTHPFMISKLEDRRFAAEGSPADCIMAGLHEVLEDRTVDLILSGVNRGNNSAENALYSGTLGGAMEGALQGIKAFALSQYLGPDNFNVDDPFEAAGIHGADVIRRVLAAEPKSADDYGLFYNVNFPPCPAAAVAGVRVAAQGIRPNTKFHVESHLSPAGRKFLWARGTDQRQRSAEGTDAAVNLENFISVTPMRADLTAHDALAPLKAIE
jgi:5'-nucleotidase